jgi:hypothetical protein
MVSIYYWNVTKIIRILKITILCFGSIWRTPILGALMCIFTRHWPRIHEFWNTEYEWNQSNCSDTTEAYIQSYTDIQTDDRYQKPDCCHLGSWKRVNPSESWHRFFFSHNSFSYILHIRESKMSHYIGARTVHFNYGTQWSATVQSFHYSVTFFRHTVTILHHCHCTTVNIYIKNISHRISRSPYGVPSYIVLLNRPHPRVKRRQNRSFN